MQIKNILNSRLAAVVAGGAAIAILGSTAGFAAASITSGDIANETIRSKDIMNGTLKPADFSNGAKKALEGERGAAGVQGPAGAPGAAGLVGPQGESGLAGAYYAQATYLQGQTNAGAIATVACEAQTDTAISGGVQTLGLDADANSRNTPVSSSFPGRMEWAAEPDAPFADRLDGWIVQFGGNAGEVSDKNPEKVVVWALCVPGADIAVENTYNE